MAAPIDLSTPSGPLLSLVPTPERGNAPLTLNVSASVAGGTPPFALSVCFATQDHSTQTPDCAPAVANWNGGAPLQFPHVYANPGNYTVLGIISDHQGSRVGSTALIVVTRGPALSARASESVSQGAAPLTVEFSQSLYGGTPPTSIQWDFGDGSVGSGVVGVAVAHVYSAPGRYTPTLTVTDAAGHLAVTPLPTISVSNGGAGGLPWGGWGAGGGEVTILATGVATTAALLAIAISVRSLRRRRWKREGDQLLEEIERDDRSGLAPRPPP